MVAWRYKISLLMVKNISHVNTRREIWVAWRYEISVLMLKNISHVKKYILTLVERFRISARPCNIFYLVVLKLFCRLNCSFGANAKIGNIDRICYFYYYLIYRKLSTAVWKTIPHFKNQVINFIGKICFSAK